MPTFISPLSDYRISSDFGGRASPGGIGSTNHKGIDLAAPTGTPVFAPTDIRITQAGWSGGYGNLVRGMDGAGNTYEFGHLSSIGVKSGDTISAGSVLGAVGSTGNSTGPHLHFGIKDAAGKFIDPKTLLSQASKLGQDAIDKGKKLVTNAVKAALLSNPATAPLVIASDVLGIGGGGDDCGSLDFICKLKKWFKEADFFARLGMVIVAIIFIVAAFSLLARGQVSQQLVKTVKGA